MARLRRLQSDRDAGFSLAEVLVAMMLLAILGSLVMGAMITTERALQVTDDEATGLADIRPVAERLARDIRGARGVDASSSATTLTIWIDSDSDYIQDSSENVTWSLAVVPGDSEHYQVSRQVQGSAAQIEAKSLVSALAFVYDSVTAGLSTRLVTVSMTYNARIRGGVSLRKLTFDTRLRNVA